MFIYFQLMLYLANRSMFCDRKPLKRDLRGLKDVICILIRILKIVSTLVSGSGDKTRMSHVLDLKITV